jgi:hypothetical protein
MRVLAVLLATAVAIFAMSISAQARRGCDRQCLLRRIAALESQIAQLNANAIKAGETVTIHAPGGCLSWGGPSPGTVIWVPPPCPNSTWAIGNH